MSSINSLALSIRERDNPSKIGIQIGRVVEAEPLKIEIGKLHATGTNLKIAAHLVAGYTRHVSIASDPPIDGVETLKKDVLEVGDWVIVAVSDNNQVFYVIDKAVNA